MSEFVCGKYTIPILYEDNHLLVVCKPVNMAVQADASGDLDLQTALKGYIREKYHKPGEAFLALCHRLDRPVGGVMVLCRTSKSAERLTNQFSAHTNRKSYLCVVQGKLAKSISPEDWLVKGEDGFVRVVRPGTPGAKLAKLTATPLAVCDGCTLVRVELHTGRAHQIRVQMLHAGYPLWGDNRYGGGKPGQQIALWANVLEFKHPTTGENLHFREDPPHSLPWTMFDPKLFADGEA